MIRSFFICLFMAVGGLSEAQQQSPPMVDMEAITDNFLSFPDDDTNYEEHYENLTQLLAHPMELNLVNAEELRGLKILSENQIQQFITYRDSIGALLDIYELQSIPTFDIETIQRLMPFVVIKDPSTQINMAFWDRIKKESTNYLILRADRILEDKAGFSTQDQSNRFQGSPYRMYTCFRSFRSNDFSAGFTFEKDAGESWSWAPEQKQYGADHMAGHLQVQNKGRVKNLIVGDFQSQFGQGITYGGLFGMGKSGETILSIRKSTIGFLPYTSAYEAGSLRGLATTIEIKKFLFVSALISSQMRDANTAIVENKEIVTSRIISGLHRNQRELSHRKNLRENTAGIVLHYKTRKSDGGLIFNTTHFNKEIVLNETVYNQKYFQGKRNTLTGAYFNYTINQASFFSELSTSTTGDFAIVTGILTSLARNFDLALLYRKYSSGFTSFYSNALAENSTPRNESGIYWGWKYGFNKKIYTTGYLDLFRFPWLRYRSYKPSEGHEWLLRLNYQPSRKVTCFVQVRNEEKERNISDASQTLYHTKPASKTNYWLGTSYEVTPHIRVKTRAQFSTFTMNGKSTSGMTLVQDLQFEINKLEFTARYALFDTDDYDNRQYVYENDVWLAYSLPAYHGIGTRRYLQVQYKCTSWLNIWIRYAQLHYHNQNYISSGLDQINGNTKNEIKIQFKITF